MDSITTQKRNALPLSVVGICVLRSSKTGYSWPVVEGKWWIEIWTSRKLSLFTLGALPIRNAFFRWSLCEYCIHVSRPAWSLTVLYLDAKASIESFGHLVTFFTVGKPLPGLNTKESVAAIVVVGFLLFW